MLVLPDLRESWLQTFREITMCFGSAFASDKEHVPYKSGCKGYLLVDKKEVQVIIDDCVVTDVRTLIDHARSKFQQTGQKYEVFETVTDENGTMDIRVLRLGSVDIQNRKFRPSSMYYSA